MTVELYHPPQQHREAYDESLDESGQCRPHWAQLLHALEKIGTTELTRRWGRAERRIRENGITYNIYGDPEGVNRPWKIDMIPLLIQAESEWQSIEEGLLQRAELLSAILEGHLRRAAPDYKWTAALGVAVRQSRLPAPTARRTGSCCELSAHTGRGLWHILPMVNGGCSQTARRHHLEVRTPLKIARSCRVCCPTFFGIPTSGGSRISFARSVRHSPPCRPWKIRESCCSLPVRTMKLLISNTRIKRVISASLWLKAQTPHGYGDRMVYLKTGHRSRKSPRLRNPASR